MHRIGGGEAWRGAGQGRAGQSSRAGSETAAGECPGRGCEVGDGDASALKTQ